VEFEILRRRRLGVIEQELNTWRRSQCQSQGQTQSDESSFANLLVRHKITLMVEGKSSDGDDGDDTAINMLWFGGKGKSV